MWWGSPREALGRENSVWPAQAPHMHVSEGAFWVLQPQQTGQEKGLGSPAESLNSAPKHTALAQTSQSQSGTWEGSSLW